MKTLVIGRSPFADVVVADGSVAPHHAELIMTDDGRLYLVDCASTGGTWRQPAGDADPEDAIARGERDRSVETDNWRPVRQAFVVADEPLRLGDYRCTGKVLLRLARDDPQPHRSAEAGASAGASLGDGGRQPLRGRVERDAATGEIVRRRP